MAKKKPIPKRKNVGQTASIKDFIDMVVPGIIKFNPDHYIVGDTYRSVWAIREYPPVTSEQAILSRFGDRESVTLRIYSRYVDAREQERIIQNAARKNKMMLGGDNMQESITAESNLEDVATLLKEMARNLEPLLHCSCYIELIAPTYEKLRELQTEASMELTRNKLTADKLMLRQKEGCPVPCYR